jgi:hypothetical protein
MSISGWYHAPAEPSDMAHASLQQLQDGGLAAGADNFAPEHYTRFPDAGEAAAGACYVCFVHTLLRPCAWQVHVVHRSRARDMLMTAVSVWQPTCSVACM